MPSLITSPRGRALAVSIAGAVLQAAVQLTFGLWQGWDPLLALAAGILVAVLAGVLGGRLAGVVVAAAGAALFVAYAADDAEIAALTVPAWIAAGLAAGIVSDLRARALRGRERADAALAATERVGQAAFATLSPDDTVAGWDAEAERLFRRPGVEALGAPVSLLGAELERLVASARAADELVEGAVEYDGDERTLRLLARAVAFATDAGDAVRVAATDVTEAVSLERDLRELEARHEALLQNLPVVAYAHSPGDRDALSYVSPRVRRLLGYTPEEVEGMGLGRLVHPDDRDRVVEQVEAAGARGPLRTEYVAVARDGRLVPVRDEATTVRDAAGNPLYVQGFLVDLGERKELVEELERVAAARGEARADALRRQARLDLAVAAGEALGSAPDVETALRRVAERAVREFADWCAVDLVEDEGELSRLAAAHASAIHDAGTRAAAPEAVPEADVRQVAESGEPVVVPALDGPAGGEAAAGGGSRILAPLAARGHSLGVLSFARGPSARAFSSDDLELVLDIARRAALTLDAERLHQRVELEADAARVLAYVADGVFLVDRPGVIRLWNPAAEAITGFAATTMVGRRPSEVIPGWENFREQIPVAGSGGPALPQTVWVDTDEGQRWISISAVEFFGGTVYAFRDITEAHRLEELKGDFVATASHELRTPLAAVYGAAQTLRRHDFALDEAGRERFVTMIVEEADRLSRIVNEILLATQLDAGGPALAVEPFDPADLAWRLAEATRSHLRPEITLDVVVSGKPPEVAADRDKVRQVLVNLIDNAVKYSPSGGKVELGVEPDEDAVRFYVRDEGLGIPANEQERIFQKFYRLDPSMTRGVGGTGLGLYICHELVRRMGGRIWVESEHGDGSTFSFELPAAVATPGTPAPAETTRGDAI